MDPSKSGNSSSNEDDEPKICTVFSNPESSSTKTIFDTIAFTAVSKKTTDGYEESSRFFANSTEDSKLKIVHLLE